ncbi:MAG: hypothetical protein PF572_05980 [Patescibacteria group bacterium]|jgi:hypothetical protein|nr:hypothetical protein [Patescibacteria group bacterium]
MSAFDNLVPCSAEYVVEANKLGGFNDCRYLEIMDSEVSMFYALMSLRFKTEQKKDVCENDLCLVMFESETDRINTILRILRQIETEENFFQQISRLMEDKYKNHLSPPTKKPRFSATLSCNNSLVVASGDCKDTVLADAWRRGVEYPWLIKSGRKGYYPA